MLDNETAEATQSPDNPFDTNILSAAIADEVKHTVFTLMTNELPRMVRDAVYEAINTMPTDITNQPKLSNGAKSLSKKVAPSAKQLPKKEQLKNCKQKDKYQKSG